MPGWLPRFLTRSSSPVPPPSPADDGTAMLREHVASLQSRLEQLTGATPPTRESIDVSDRVFAPWERFIDGDRVLFPTGFPGDRKAGRNWPVIITEIDLRQARSFCRLIADTNPICIAFLDHVTNFVVGNGFKWTVGLKGVPGSDDEKDPDCMAAQRVLDEFRSLNGWGDEGEASAGDDMGTDDSAQTDMEAEAWRSAMRDGEFFGRLYPGGATTNGVPYLRRVNPECVSCPPGEDQQGDWSWGILTQDGDRLTRLKYHMVDPDRPELKGDIVDAGRMLQLKFNVDSDVKRGLPDFWPMQDEVQNLRTLWRNMSEVSGILSAIAYIRQHAPGVTGTQIASMIPRTVSGTDNSARVALDPGQGADRFRTYTRHEAGTIIDVTNAMQYQAPPMIAGAPGFVQVMQAVLRIIGVRWGCPEYFSGDSSSSNYASTLVAGGPFEKATQRRQRVFKQFQQNLALRVLLMAAESGRLTREQVSRLSIKATPPAVAIANKQEDTSRRSMLFDKAGLSAATWLREEGYDPEQEKALKEQEQPPEQPGGMPGGMPGGAPPDGMPAPGGDDQQPPPDEQQADDGAALSDEDFASIFESVAEREWQENEWYYDADGDMVPFDQGDDLALLTEADGLSAKGPGGRTPPRPGLVWKDATKRWIADPTKAKTATKRTKKADAATDGTPAVDSDGVPAAKPKAEPKVKAPTKTAAKKAQAEQTVATLRTAFNDPTTITPDQLPAIKAALDTLTVPQQKEFAKQLGQKIGGTKAAVAERIVAAVTAHVAKAQAGGQQADTQPAEAPPTATKPTPDQMQAAAKAAGVDLDSLAPAERKFIDDIIAGKVTPADVQKAGETMKSDQQAKVSKRMADVSDDEFKAEFERRFGAAKAPAPAGTPKPSASNPEETGFTGTANNTKYIDGVAQKGQEEPTGADRPKATEVPASAIKKGDRDNNYNYDDPGFQAAGREMTSDPKFRATFMESYSDLMLLKEYRDGLVEIPRMYRDMAERSPNLTVPQFHAALMAIAKNGHVELHELNEVRDAWRPEQAMMKEGRLLYYVRTRPEVKSADDLKPNTPAPAATPKTSATPKAKAAEPTELPEAATAVASEIEQHIADWTSQESLKAKAFTASADKTGDFAIAKAEVDDMLDRLDASGLSDGQYKAMAKRFTGIAEPTRKKARLALQGRMTTSMRILLSRLS